MLIPPFIFLGFFILSFAFLQEMVPYKIIMRNDALILRAKYRSISMKIDGIKGYDVDYSNNIRLIYKDSKNKNKILNLANIDRKTQREVTKYYGLKRFKFKFNEPWGIEEEDEDIEEIPRGKISFTITTFSFVYAIIISLIVAIIIFIFLANDIDITYIFIIMGPLFISALPIIMLAHKKGWFKREPIREKK